MEGAWHSTLGQGFAYVIRDGGIQSVFQAQDPGRQGRDVVPR